jgi:hypothetical protein
VESIIDHTPRMSLELAPGPEAQGAVRDALESLRDELDAVILEQLGVLIGALSRTQLSQLEAKDGLELRLWVFPDLVRVEVRDHPHGLFAGNGDSGQSLSNGWRLGMVEHLADRWGVIRQDDSSFLIWFEVVRAGSGIAARAAAGGGW